MNKFTAVLLITVCCILFSACNSKEDKTETTFTVIQSTTSESTTTVATTQPITNTTAEPATQEPQETTAFQEETQPQNNAQTEYIEEQSDDLQMTIGGTPVSVDWEENESVQSLKELCRNQPLTIHMSMYGGFEQVGNIGTELPRNDVQTTTSAGDIVLYSGNQIVVFYGSNTWAYTRLGHITDKTAEEMSDLLSNNDTTIIIGFY